MKQKKNRNIAIGAGFFYIAITIAFLILLGRFLYIQLTGKVDGQEVAAVANTPYNSTLQLVAERGAIVDRNGKIIAQDTSAYTVVAILDKDHKDEKGKPWYVDDPANVAKQLAPIINMTEQKIYKLLTNVSDGTKQVELGPGGRGISIKQKKSIDALKLKGITFIKDKKRFYPNGDFASYVVGYTHVAKNQKKNGSPYEGAMGIEMMYNDQLEETNGTVKYERDHSGNRLPFGKREVVDKKDGDTVYLTIDHTIQAFLEEAMENMVNKYNPEKAIAIVMNPKTGEILALHNSPSFDPNKKDISNYLNDSISYPYEPGSTMKIFTLAAAIEEGKWAPNDTFVSGSYSIGSQRIHDHNRVGWGRITYLEGIQRSSNVAMANLVQKKLGTDTFYDYLLKFGFDKKTGIDLPGETKGTILYKYPIEKLTTAFGQGTSITAMQQMAAATAIATNGKMMQPYVVDKIVNSDGEIVEETKPKVTGQPISKETAEEVRKILETVVTSPKGTGTGYKIKGYKVAGKTGTAQIPNPKGGGYLYGHGQYIYSFLGMAPADDPELIMYISVEKPKLSDMETGSEPTSAVFKSVMKNSLQYLNIKPSTKKSTTTVQAKTEYDKTIPDVTNQSVQEAKLQLKDSGLKPIIIGNGNKVIEQNPKVGVKVLEGEKVILKTSNKGKMPNLTGWSLRDVQKFAKLYNLRLEVSGNGYVISQRKKAGATFKHRDILSVELLPPSGKKVKKSIQKVDGPID